MSNGLDQYLMLLGCSLEYFGVVKTVEFSPVMESYPHPKISHLPLYRMIINSELVSFSVPKKYTIILVGQLGGTGVQRN